MGLKTAKLTTEQIIELLYSSYNITQSLRKKVQNSEELAESTVIQQTESGETISKEKEAGTTEQPTQEQAPPSSQDSGNVKVPINQG